jgi:hypothetical protein
MKKLMAIVCCALAFGLSAVAADTQFKVYDVIMTLQTTKAGGKTTTSCGETYTWRTKGTRNVKGVIAGCGCIAAAADPSCDNFLMYFWDVTTKTQITNFTYTTALVQRIGKKGELVEQLVTFVVTEPNGEKFELQLAGIGKYIASKNGANYDTMTITDGKVTGIMDAPYNVTLGSCNACSTTPDTIDQTQAVAICEDGTCTASENSDVTVVYGKYSFKYNNSKTTKCEKRGISKSALGLPAYVNL